MLDQIPTETGALPPQRLSRAERRARDAEAQARREDILAGARLRRQDRTDQANRRRKATRSIDRAAWRATARARAERLYRTLVLVGAIVGVNLVAVAGQVAAFHKGFDWPLAGAFGAAAVIESIAIYVGWHAHVALIEGDSVFRLRVTSYGIALIVGGLNYHHYAPDWQLTDQAVVFGLASLLSPWLWAMHSRHQHRTQLRATGLIDPRAPKFSALRWLLHKDETWQALKWAVRHSEQSPAAAILAVQMEETTTEVAVVVDRTRDDLLAAQTALIRTQSDLITVTQMYLAEVGPAVGEVTVGPSIGRPLGELDTGASAVTAAATAPTEPADDEVFAAATIECPSQPPVPDTDAHPDLDTNEANDDDPDNDRDRPDDQDNRRAEKWIREAIRKGRTPKYSEVEKRFGFSRSWAGLRVQAAREEMAAKGYRFRPGNVVVPPTELTTINGAESVHADDIEMTSVGGA